MKNTHIILPTFVAYIIAIVTPVHAMPTHVSEALNDADTKVTFEVHAPWNIMDGEGKEIAGKAALALDGKLDSLRASVIVHKVKYKAGLSVAGRLVSAWLRANDPTPGKFVIASSALSCKPETILPEKPCKGSVDGQLTLWGQQYKIDVPVEVRPSQHGVMLTGAKEIKWGEYGFGDPKSTISTLGPVVDLAFSISIPTKK